MARTKLKLQAFLISLADFVQDATHRLVSDTEKALWNGKQDSLGFTAENQSNKLSSFQTTPDDTHYPTEKLVRDNLDLKLDSSLKGSSDGLAELNSTGKVPSSQLPAFVDDVIESADFASLPTTGETGKIYITLDDNKTYRWSGSVYAEISSSLALGESINTAYRGDRGKTAYDHSQATGNPHGATTNDIADTVDKRYITDAQRTNLENLSGVNTGDETDTSIKTKLGISILSGDNTGDQDLSALMPKAGGTFSGDVTLGDGKNIIANATTGSKIGTAPTQKIAFYGNTPIVRPSAYTQTYATPSKTVPNPTAGTLTDSTGGTADLTLASVGTTYSQTTIRNNFADLASMVNKHTADNLALFKVVTQIIDDLQALGLLS